MHLAANHGEDVRMATNNARNGVLVYQNPLIAVDKKRGHKDLFFCIDIIKNKNRPKAVLYYKNIYPFLKTNIPSSFPGTLSKFLLLSSILSSVSENVSTSFINVLEVPASV